MFSQSLCSPLLPVQIGTQSGQARERKQSFASEHETAFSEAASRAQLVCAGLAHNCDQLVSIWDWRLRGRTSQGADTATCKRLHRTGAQGPRCLGCRADLPWGRERKGGTGGYGAFFPNPLGAATFGSSINPGGAAGSSLLALELSGDVEHLLCLEHFARCFTLSGGSLKKEVGWWPRPYIVLKNDKVEKVTGGESSKRPVGDSLPQASPGSSCWRSLQVRAERRCIDAHKLMNAKFTRCPSFSSLPFYISSPGCDSPDPACKGLLVPGPSPMLPMAVPVYVHRHGGRGPWAPSGLRLQRAQ